MEERRLRNVEMPAGDQRLHVAEEESQQQGAYVSAVNVGVAHDNDSPVAQFCQVELIADANAGGGNNVFDLLVFQHLVETGALDIQYFTAQWQNGLEVTVAPLLCAPPRRIPLHQVEFAAVSMFLGTVG